MPPQDDDGPPHKKLHKDFDITRASRHKLKKQLAKMQTDGPPETPPETADSHREDTETASKDHPQELQKLHVPQGGQDRQDGHESQDLGDPRVPQGPHKSHRPHTMPVQINDNRRISITNNHNHSTYSSSNNYNHTTSKGGNTTNTAREDENKEVEEEQDEDNDDKDARRSTIGRRPLSLWIPRFVWAAVQRTARATVPARWLLICTGEFLLFPVIGLGTLSALFPAYVPGPWEMTKWGLVTIFVRASSPPPTPTPFPSPSPLPVMPLPSSSSSSSPSVFTPSSVFENPETLKRLMTDVFSTGAWLDGYAGHPSALSGPLRTLAQTSVGRFMNLHTYQVFVNLETAVDRDFPRALASTLGELRLNADDIARYPSRSYVAPTASSGSSTLSRLYRSVANVVGAPFRGRAQPTPTPLPVSRAMARVADAGTLLEAAGASLGEAMKSFPPGQSVSDGACRWASQLKGVAGSVRRMGGSWSSQPLLASPRPSSSSSSSSDDDDDEGSRPADVVDAGVDGSEDKDKAMGNVMNQQNVLQVVESSRNEAEYLCAVMKGDTAARIENARQRLDDYARHLRGWKMRVSELEKTFVGDEGSVKVWESLETLDAVLDETDGKLVRLYTKVDFFLREAFATEGNHTKRA